MEFYFIIISEKEERESKSSIFLLVFINLAWFVAIELWTYKYPVEKDEYKNKSTPLFRIIEANFMRLFFLLTSQRAIYELAFEIASN